MTLKTDLIAEVRATFKTSWDEQAAQKVPEPTDLRLNSNHAKDLEKAVVLYADLDGSTQLVDNHSWSKSAEIYKTFLRCSSQIIKGLGGVITAYDGDRVMAVFTGDSKCSSAAKAALRIHWAVNNIIQPEMKAVYVNSDYVVKHVVGIDLSQLRAARIGVHGDNDIVWIGRAANHAAKLTTLSGAATWITKAVYDSLSDETKYSSDGQDMWAPRTWTSMGNAPIYSSIWSWGFD